MVRGGAETDKTSVLMKPTNYDDFVHFLAVHNNKTKSGVVIVSS